MSITISPETEQRLREEADRCGQPVDILAEALILAGLRIHNVSNTVADAPEDQLSPEELADSVASVRAGIADAEAGRLTPAEGVFAEIRQAVKARAA